MTADRVFTPTSPADQTFVPREVEERALRAALKTRGTQIILYGESGAGKSTLAIKVLESLDRRHIVTRCTGATDYTAVLLSAFDQIGAFTVVATGSTDSTDLHADTSITFGNDLLPAKTTFEGGFVKVVEQTEERRRVVEYQLTAENLAKALVMRELSWVVEDFHKVAPETRAALADVLKVFSDNAAPKTAVIILGASETPGDVVNAPADMVQRTAQIPVPPLDDHQLGTILDEGGRLMNVDFTEVRQTIIRTSAGVASVTHGLALRCLQELFIETPPTETIRIEPATLRAAAWSYASTMQGGMKEAFEKAIVLKRERKYDNCAVIIKAIATLPERGGTHAEILAEIKKTYPNYPPSNLTNFLPQLGSEERGAMIRKAADGRYRFDRPLQHTYAQIRFQLEPRADDIFAGELATQITELEKEQAAAAVREDDDAAD